MTMLLLGQDILSENVPPPTGHHNPPLPPLVRAVHNNYSGPCVLSMPALLHVAPGNNIQSCNVQHFPIKTVSAAEGVGNKTRIPKRALQMPGSGGWGCATYRIQERFDDCPQGHKNCRRFVHVHRTQPVTPFPQPCQQRLTVCFHKPPPSC